MVRGVTDGLLALITGSIGLVSRGVYHYEVNRRIFFRVEGLQYGEIAGA